MKVAGRGSAMPAAGSSRIVPDAAMLVRALRQIGYSFEQAVADLIDNAISAGARNVLVRFFAAGDRIRSVAIADDGEGMSAQRLAEAMKFGSETDLNRRTLGKYGMGMKLASLSHARVLTVITSREGELSAARWSLDGIGRDWECEMPDRESACQMIEAPWRGLELPRSGTLVVWDDVDRLPVGTRGLRETLRQLQRRLQTHLGLTFHRFLDGSAVGGRLRLLMDLQMDGAHEQPHFVEIGPLDPFGYEASGHPDWPQTFHIRLEHGQEFDAQACIWPANSQAECYALGNRAAARQGFYFYRNDRLIQCGGWNGLVQNDSEPHSSLARVRIDLPESLDAAFALNVQKSAVVVPPTFLPAIAAATTARGLSFDAYRATAQDVYRHTDARAERQLPIVPGSGLPAGLRRLLAERLAGGENGRRVDFGWAELADSSRVFEIDRGSRRILINRDIRSGLTASGVLVDLSLLKLCLFFILQDDLDRDRVSGARRERLDTINAALGRALSLARG